MRIVPGSRLLGSALVVGGVLTGSLMLGTTAASAEEEIGSALSWKTTQDIPSGPCGSSYRTHEDTVQFDSPQNTTNWINADSGQSADGQIKSSVQYQEGVIEADVYAWCSKDQRTKYRQYVPTAEGYQHRTRHAGGYCSNGGCWFAPPTSSEWKSGLYSDK